MSRCALKKTPNVIVLVIALLALAVAGCGDSGSSGGANSDPAKPGGTLRVGLKTEVTSLDPREAVDPSSVQVIGQMMEPLYRTTADGEVIPWLVRDSRRSADGLQWTFDLKPNVRFSNGEPMTAEDVVFSLEAVRQSLNWSFMFEAITKIEAASPSRVTITTKTPVAPMLPNLTLFATAIVPADYAGMSAKEFAQRPIGTGPFQLTRWARGESLTLEPNPHYWESDRPLPDSVVISPIPDDNSRVSQLRGGQLDVAEAPPWSQLDSIEQDPQLFLGEYALGRADYFMANLKSDLFRDPRLREAVNLALDREGIVDAALSGHGEVAGSWLAPSLLYSDPSIEAPTPDPAKAKALVAEAVEDGARPAFTMLHTAGDSYASTAAQIIQENLREVGFDVSLQSLDESTLLAQLGGGKYDAALLYAYSDIVDPSEVVAFYVALEGIYTGTDTTEVGALATEADQELDADKRRSLYYEIQRQVNAENNLIPLDYQPFVWASAADVAGFEVSPTNLPWFSATGFSD